MFEGFQSYFYFGRNYYSVWYDLEGEADSEDFLFVCQGKRLNNHLNIKKKISFKEFSELSKYIRKNSHIHLILTGKQILHKIIKKSESDTSEKILSEAFPNLNRDHFYYSIVPQVKSYLVILCRKSVIEKVLKKLIGEKISVVNLSLGFQNISKVLNQFKPGGFSLRYYHLEWNDKNIESISQTACLLENSTYTLEDDDYPAPYLLPLSSFSNYFHTSTQIHSNIPALTNSLTSSYREKKFFRKYIFISCLFFLIILLINFLFFENRYASLQELKAGYQNELLLKEEISNNREALSMKRKLASDLLRYDNSRASFYINQIVTSIPASINFDKINYQPLQSAPRMDHPLDIKENFVELKGNSSDGKAFNNWIKELAKYKWIKDIEIIRYTNTHLKSEFGLKLQIEDEN